MQCAAFEWQDLVRTDQVDEAAPGEMDAFLYKVAFQHKLPGPSDTHISCSCAKNAEVSPHTYVHARTNRGKTKDSDG